MSLDALCRALPPSAVVVDPEQLAEFAGDASPAAAVVPRAVVLASSVEHVATTLRWATATGVPVTPRGAGTGKAGGCIASPGRIVLSLAPMNRILSVRPEHGWAEVEPGVITGPFREAMEGEHDLFYPPDPNSLATCTLGGNVATNAGGPVALKYGVTSRFVLGVTAVLADGTVIETGKRQPKSVAGYDLTSLLVGSEGTLAVIVGARLGLLPRPREIRTALLPFASLRDATRAVAGARATGRQPRAMELVDGVVLERVRPHSDFPIDPAWGALLLVEFDGAPGRPARDLEDFVSALPCAPLEVRRADDPDEREALWATRRFLSKLVKRGAVGWLSEDVAVPLGSVPDLVDGFAAIADRHQVVVASYGHAGDGNLHVNVLWEDHDGAARGKGAVEDVFRATLALGGTISGEHGIGTLKRPYLAWEQAAPVLDLQRAIKQRWDPAGILNPGKLLPE